VKRGWIVTIAMLLLLVSGCGGSSETSIQLDDPWARAAKAAEMENQDQTGTETGGMGHMSGSLSAAYMVITNNSNQPDRLLRASSDAARNTELHISEIVDGVMSMHPVDSIEVPANGQVDLKPGGLHIMLIGLTGDLVAGEKMPLTLEFENAGKIQVEAEIRAP